MRSRRRELRRRASTVSATQAATMVMGTGIVSIALGQTGQETLSNALLALAGLVWLAGVVLPLAGVRDRSAGARGPLALASVAASAVLGASLVERRDGLLALLLLVIAAALWLVLLVPSLRNSEKPTPLAALMLPVATQALAALCAQLGGVEDQPWLVVAAVGLLMAGLALYVFAITRLEPHALLTARGEHWVAGGALAISSLAAGRLVVAAERLAFSAGVVDVLKVALAALWVASMAWLPVLLVGEALAPRPGYDARRWATVFPAGMYAACSFAAGAALGAPAVTDFARVWVWVALAVWAATVAGALSRVRPRG